MLLFRDEEHVDRWAEQGGHPTGGLLTPEQLWELARRWYQNRLDPDWRRRTANEAQVVFEDIGLTGPFWELGAG
jgi:Alkylmercury lyase